MKAVVNLLFILGVVVATIGAAGFEAPSDSQATARQARSTEPGAWALFASGLAVLALGAVVGRLVGRSPTATVGSRTVRGRDEILVLLERIRDQVAALDEGRGALSGEQVRQDVHHLLNGDYFDLVAAREDLLAMVGFATFARVWDGVATAERLLARTWTLATDGHREEAVAELPRARSSLERACGEMAAIPAPSSSSSAR